MTEIVNNYPVARFYYRGSHKHPVKRTVVVTESTGKTIKGYELRESRVTRSLRQAPIKTYSRSKIARINELDRKTGVRKENPNSDRSTLVRKPIFDLIMNGI